MLSRRPCGHFAENIKCQYHGWEYDCTGNTRKIPDAKSFKPMEKGTLGLTKFRCETAGQLVFVTLDDDAPPLAEFLGEYLFDLCGRWFSADHRLTVPLDIDHECNWKVVVENVRVLSVGQGADERQTGAQLASSVTLEVTTEGARKIALARNIGTLSLSLRAISDDGEAGQGLTTISAFGGGRAQEAGDNKDSFLGALTRQDQQPMHRTVIVTRGLVPQSYTVVAPEQ
jgi:hypothetical protein